MLTSFFKAKQQNHLFKGLNAIKYSSNLSQEKVAPVYPKANGTTRRTYLNTTFTAS